MMLASGDLWWKLNGLIYYWFFIDKKKEKMLTHLQLYTGHDYVTAAPQHTTSRLCLDLSTAQHSATLTAAKSSPRWTVSPKASTFLQPLHSALWAYTIGEEIVWALQARAQTEAEACVVLDTAIASATTSAYAFHFVGWEQRVVVRCFIRVVLYLIFERARFHGRTKASRS